MTEKEKHLFLNDFYLPEMLIAHTVRSKISRGEIVRIDFPEEINGVTVITGDDIPGRNEVLFFKNKVPVFAGKKINYRGEPLFLILADNEELLEEYKSKISIEYNNQEEYSFDSSAYKENQIIYEKTIEIPEKTKNEKAMQGFTVEDSFFANEYHSRYCEPFGAVVEPVDDDIIIHTVSQWPNHVKKTAAEVLGINLKNVIVKISAISSPLEGRIWYPSLISSQAAIAALLTKRPVKLILNKYESFNYTPRQFPYRIYFKSFISGTTIEKTVVNIEIDSGSYPLIIDDIIDRIIIQATGVYGIKKASVNIKIIKTNKPPMSFISSFSFNQIQISLEKHISNISRKLKKSPAEFRKINLFSNHDFYYLYEKHLNQNKTTITAGIKNAENVLDRVLIISDFERKYSAYELFSINKNKNAADNKSRGIGIALSFYQNDIPISTLSKEKISVKLYLDSKSCLTIYTSTVPDGINNYEIWKNTASEILNINHENIFIAQHETCFTTYSSPYPFSKGLSGFIELLKKSCQNLQKKRFREPLPIEVNSSIMIESLKKGDISWGASVVELVIDNFTFEIDIKGIWSAFDSGNITWNDSIDKKVYSGIIDSLNWISGAEYMLENEDKIIQNDNLWHYFNIPIVTEYLNTLKNNKMLAIGDLTLQLVPAAYCSALSQASGKNIDKIPLTLEEIYNIMKHNYDNTV